MITPMSDLHTLLSNRLYGLMEEEIGVMEGR